MGIDSKLWHKETDTTIYCDRLHNLYNDYSDSKGFLYYLINKGLPVYIIRDLCLDLNRIINQMQPDIYTEILEQLVKYNDNDILVLIDENHPRYYNDKTTY